MQRCHVERERDRERWGRDREGKRETARDREMGERKTYITTYRSATCNIKHQREGGRERETERDRERQRETERTRDRGRLTGINAHNGGSRTRSFGCRRVGG